MNTLKDNRNIIDRQSGFAESSSLLMKGNPVQSRSWGHKTDALCGVRLSLPILSLVSVKLVGKKEESRGISLHTILHIVH